jgi:hypothetical protein
MPSSTYLRNIFIQQKPQDVVVYPRIWVYCISEAAAIVRDRDHEDERLTNITMALLTSAQGGAFSHQLHGGEGGYPHTEYKNVISFTPGSSEPSTRPSAHQDSTVFALTKPAETEVFGDHFWVISKRDSQGYPTLERRTSSIVMCRHTDCVRPAALVVSQPSVDSAIPSLILGAETMYDEWDINGRSKTIDDRSPCPLSTLHTMPPHALYAFNLVL